MSKRLILILALAFVVGLAFTAYAEVQNVKVSGDITLTAIGRNNLSLTKDESVNDYGKKIRAMLSQVRVRVDADLTDNVSTTVRLLNERTWGEELDEPGILAPYKATENSSIDIDLAYVALKEFLYSPLTLVIGRQELKFGNNLVVGARTTNAIAGGHGNANRFLPNSLDDFSMRKSFDAIRATLNYDPLVVDAIYAVVSESDVSVFDDVTLMGVNANYAVDKNLNIEGYTFLRSRDTGVIAPAAAPTTAPTKGENLYTTGAKVNYTGIKDMSLGLEAAFQYGSHIASTTLYPNEGQNTNVERKVRAWALQAMADYQIPMMTKYAPMVSGSYTYLSGDKASSTRTTHKGWDPMFEDQNSGTLFNKIFALTNMQIINLNLSAKPVEDIKVTLSYYNLRANQPYVTEGTLTRRLSGIAGDPVYTMKPKGYGLGNEVDLGITYDYTEDVQFALSGGAFIPGACFQTKPNKQTAKQLVGSMKVTF